MLELEETVSLEADSALEGAFLETLIWPTVVCDPAIGLTGGAVTGRLQNINLILSISVFQWGMQSVYSSGMFVSFFSINLPRVTNDSKKGPSQ